MICEKVLAFVALILSPAFAEYFEECTNVVTDSFIAVNDDCRSFIHCNDEEASLKYTCPEGTYFQEESGKCEFDFDNICLSVEESNEHNAKDDKKETAEETTSSIFVPVSTLMSGTIYQHNNLVTIPKCGRYENAYYPHLKHCEYYYKCVAGYLTILRCNFYYAWDYQKEMCVPFNMVDCINGSKLSIHKPKMLGNDV